MASRLWFCQSHSGCLPVSGRSKNPVAYVVHKVVCLGWFSAYSGIPPKQAPMPVKAWTCYPEQAGKETASFLLPQPYTGCQQKGWPRRSVDRPTSNGLIKKKDPSQVCLGTWVSVNSGCIVKADTKNGPHTGCSGRFLGPWGHALGGCCGTPPLPLLLSG